MITTPYEFESDLLPEELAKIGQLSLRWSHTEHIIGNCLRDMLGIDPKAATVVVFPLSLEQRLQKMKEFARLTKRTKPISDRVAALLDELVAVMPAIQYVRNNVVHAVILDDPFEGHIFHLRSKGRSLTKAQVFSSEELTNYAAHVAFTLRIALRGKGDPRGPSYTLPERPEIPEFLRTLIPTRKK